MQSSMNNVLFRWSVGDSEVSVYHLYLSITSLRRFYPDAKYAILYNGSNVTQFQLRLHRFPDIEDIEIIDQNHIQSPFKFLPDKGTAWWKWFPMNLGKSGIEIFVDNDVFFVRKPIAIEKWINGSSNMFAARDITNLNRTVNLGSFHRHMMNYGHEKTINVGLLGLRDNIWRNLFVMTANKITYGVTSSSMHIDEQGAANAAIMIAERSGRFKIERFDHNLVSYWMPQSPDQIQALHFIAHEKDNLARFYSFFEHLCGDDLYLDKYPNDIRDLYESCRTQNTDVATYFRICQERGITRSRLSPDADLLCETY